MKDPVAPKISAETIEDEASRIRRFFLEGKLDVNAATRELLELDARRRQQAAA
jgi:hypothetical protein